MRIGTKEVGTLLTKVYFVYCKTPEDILKRIDNRKDKLDADYNVYLEMKKIFEGFEEDIIEIDTSNTVKTNIDTIKLKIYSI